MEKIVFEPEVHSPLSGRSRVVIAAISFFAHVGGLMLLLTIHRHYHSQVALPQDAVQLLNIDDSDNQGQAAQVMFENQEEPTISEPSKPEASTATALDVADTVPTQQQELENEILVPADNPVPISSRQLEQKPTPRPKKVRRVAAKRKFSKKTQQTLRDVSQGFFKSLEEKRRQMMQTEKHKAKVTLDAEEMAIQQYNNKAVTLLNKTVNFFKPSHFLTENVNTTVLCAITFDKYGKLINLRFLHPNKNASIMAMEQSLYEAAQSAGLYPPIPDYLGKTTLTVYYTLDLHGERGFQFGAFRRR